MVNKQSLIDVYNLGLPTPALNSNSEKHTWFWASSRSPDKNRGCAKTSSVPTDSLLEWSPYPQMQPPILCGFPEESIGDAPVKCEEDCKILCMKDPFCQAITLLETPQNSEYSLCRKFESCAFTCPDPVVMSNYKERVINSWEMTRLKPTMLKTKKEKDDTNVDSRNVLNEALK